MDILPWLASALRDPRCTFSMGAFGAIAGFTAESASAALTETPAAIEAVSGNTAIRLLARGDLTPIAFEILSSDPRSWNHGVALCLPKGIARAACRRSVTELGEDEQPLLGRGRLFDLGLGLSQADICVRADSDSLIDELRGREGTDGMTGLPALTALLASYDHVRVTCSPLGRIETRQKPAHPPISHLPGLIAQLLTGRRTHAATTPIPAGLVPYAYVFPAHPLRQHLGKAKPFDAGDHAAFQAVLSAFGLPDLNALKSRAVAAVASRSPAADFPAPADRFASACLRVALRQMRFTHPSADLGPWLARFDAPAARVPA